MHPFIKTAVYIPCLIHLLAQPKAFAQNDRLYAIESLPLEVSAARTVSLSFAAAVKSVDRGSAELLAQKAKGTENVVLIKAAREEMEPTSLLVITADGDLHVFEVRYQQQPSSIGLQIMPSRQQPLAAQMPKTIDQNQIQQALKLAAAQPPNLRRKSLAGDVSLEVDGLYIAGAVMYLRLSLENRSVIDYQIETLRFLASDNKQIRRSASQQDELLPIGGSVATDQIRASEQKTLVVPLAKMTLPESKSLLVQLTEHSGSRHITVRLKAKHLAKIARIPSVSNL